MIKSHGDEKYGTQAFNSEGRVCWDNLVAEHRVHHAGALPDLCPTATEIAVVLAGKTRVTRRGDGELQDATGQRGTVWLCPEGVFERELKIHHPAQSILHIYVPTTRICEIAESEIGTASRAAHLKYEGGFQDPLVEQISASILERMHSASEFDDLAVDTMSSLLIVHLLQYHSTLGKANTRLPAVQGALDRRRLNRVVEYIDEHLERRILLAELADQACLSPFHFARAFKSVTGISPHQYVLRKKLAYSRKLVLREDLSLGLVADRLGFASQAHFSRLFKREFGVSPSKLRKPASR
ncbi:MAG: AraC family transcriptional regulator [Pseudomonadota bacterium]